MNEDIITEQKELCKRFGAEFVPSPDGWKVGISKNIDSGIMPINGLRHIPENGTLGWFVWAGDYSEDVDFFEPMHIEHLYEKHPKIFKYLGLPPGWRFQIDDNGYEDVWKDDELLKT